MRRALLVLVALVSLAVAAGLVYQLRSTAMFKDQDRPHAAATVLVVHVRYVQGTPASDHDARLLWDVCEGNVPGERITLSVAGGTLTARLAPALDDDMERRMEGCLQDLTLPAMLGEVLSAHDVD